MDAYMAGKVPKLLADGQSGDLTGLPLELQDFIIANLDTESAKNLQRVSKHFHDRASRRIWRRLAFYLITPRTSRGVSYKLIDALRTVTTSSHDYAQYVHHFTCRVDEENDSNQHYVGHKYLPQEDPHKLLSISLFMLLRNARNLELFHWRAPVELDTACWRAVARLQNLKELRVQLNARQPVFQFPEPRVMVDGCTREADLSYKHIAGCKDLSRLSLHDIDDLNHLSAIATCLRQSSGTLKELEISFSAALAAKARKSGSSTAPPPPPPPPPIDHLLDVDGPISDGDPSSDEPSVHNSAPSLRDQASYKKFKELQDNALSRILSVHPDQQNTSIEFVLQQSSIKASADKDSTVSGSKVELLHALIDNVSAGVKVDDLKKTPIYQLLLHKIAIDEASAFSSTTQKGPKAATSKSSTKKSGKAKASAPTHPSLLAYNLPKSSSSSSTNPWAVSVGQAPNSVYGHPMPPNPFALPSHSSAPLTIPGGSAGGMPNGTYLVPGPESMHAEISLEVPTEYADHFVSTGKYLDLYTAAVDKKVESSYLELFQFPEKMKEAENKIKKLAKLLQAPPPPPPTWPPTSNKSKKKKKKAAAAAAASYPAFVPPEVNPYSSESSVASETEHQNEIPTPTQKAEDPASESLASPYDDLGIDIVHPDPVEGDSGDEQDASWMSDDNSPQPLQDKGKGKELVSPVTGETSDKVHISDNEKVGGQVVTSEPATSPEATLRKWIREKHGLALDTLGLYHVPLKASVIGKGIQLHHLQSITLLSVGGQGPFWQLMVKAQNEAPLKLKDIHTDDVSASFLDCVSKLHGIQQLILRRRAKKASDNTTSKDSASIEEIRKLAIRPHIETLRVLYIENSQDQSWCLTEALVALLCARALNLRELAFQAGSRRLQDFIGRLEPNSSLLNLVAWHYLGVGSHSGSARHPASTLSPLGLNGEPLDPQHDSYSRDSYRTCIGAVTAWAQKRRNKGRSKLRYVGIASHLIELHGPIGSQSVPTWLMEDYMAEKARIEAKGDDGEKINESIETWAEQNGYGAWVTQMKCPYHHRRKSQIKGVVIFGPVVDKGKF